MRKAIVKIVTVLAVFALLAAIGCSLGYFASALLGYWKRKNTPIILCHHKRPAIYDRSGVLLIGNGVPEKPNTISRHAAIDGKFAAAFLGFTEFDRGNETGKSGIEKMIDKLQTPGEPVYVSIDCGIQKNMESWMERLQALSCSEYMYAVCLNSQGELLATAQRPVVDINNRQQVEGGTSLFPAVYVLPVSDDLMKLLGSSADAPPEEKAKFRFHHKLGVLSPEARGWYKGLKPLTAGMPEQAATAFNYLLAFISVAEKKPIPHFQVFSSGKQPPVVMKKRIVWLAVNQSENNIIALGKAPELNGNRLYFLICIKPQKQEIFQKIIAEIKSFG